MGIAGYLAVLRRRYVVLVVCILAGLAGGYYAGYTPTKQYQATSRSLVNLPVTSGVQDALAASQLSTNFVSTYSKIASSNAVGQGIRDELKLSDSSRALAGQLSVSVVTGTYLIDITATDPSPERAAMLANAAATSLQGVVKTLEAKRPNPVQTQLINSASVPTSPISPRPKLALSLGGSLGLVAGVLLIALLEALDRSIKTVSQGTAATGAPLLGLIPRRRGGIGVVADTSAAGLEGEPFRTLRTAIRFLDPDQPLRTILITSPTPGDGKTTVAGNLAISFALGGERVAVVDADLRRASLADFYGLERAVGVTTVVLRQVDVPDALQNWRPGLDVMPSGDLPPNPSEILGSQAMAHLLDDLAARVDIVIIDAPPVLPVTDAVVLSTQVDGVVMVQRHGRTLRTSAAEAARRLEAVGANVVGFVLNAVPAVDSRGYYTDYRYEEVPRTPHAVAPPSDQEQEQRAPAGVAYVRRTAPRPGPNNT